MLKTTSNKFSLNNYLESVSIIRNLLLFLGLYGFFFTSVAIASFEPILIDDDDQHRIWKITGANSYSDLTGKNLNDGIAPDIVKVGDYSLNYNIQDLAKDNNGTIWALSMETRMDVPTTGHAFIGRITESGGTYSYTNIVDLGYTYDDPMHKNHAKALVWDPDNKYFIYEANPTQSDSRKTTFKAFDPVTNSVVADPWGTGNEAIVISLLFLPIEMHAKASYAQGLTFGADGSLYAVIGHEPVILLKLERNANHKLTGNATMIGTEGLGKGFRNIEVLSTTSDGQLIAVVSNVGIADSAGKIYSVDLVTGEPTEIADLDNGYAYKRDWEGIVFSDPVYKPDKSMCFAMTDDAAELYSFDLDINTPPTKVVTDRVLNGEAATYRATNNAIYTFHQDLEEQDESKPSDLYKVELDGTITLIKAAFLSKKANGAEFVHYEDGSERFITLQNKYHSTISIFDATDLLSATPLKTFSLLFPDGSYGLVAQGVVCYHRPTS